MSGGQTDVWYSTVEPDRLGEPIPWIGPEPTPYWLLRAREYLERWIHQSQIRRAVGRGEWYDEKWVHPAAAVAVRGFPAGFATLPADEGTSVTVAIENGPKWSVIRQGTAWRLYDGSQPDPTVMVSMNNVTAALLYSRGMTAAQVVEGLELAGDEETGQMLAIGLSAFFGR